jgi:hypothetical protein
LAGIVHELDVTVSRQDRLGSGGARGTGAEIPLPYNPQAAERAAAVLGELTTWARHVSEQTGRSVPRGHAGAAAASVLAGSVKWLRYQQAWAEAHAALAPLLRITLRIIDRPADRVYLGPCGHTPDGETKACAEDVYAAPRAATGECRGCGVVHQVAGALQWMRDQLDDRLARPVEIVGLLRRFDEKLSYSVITKYIRQGRLVAHGHDADGRDLYRIGDVIALKREATTAAPRRSEVLAQPRP